MEKLIELLNEYREKELWYRVPEWEEKWQLWITNEQLISKKFWFIQRLVDNDKIDFYIKHWEKYLEYPIWSDNYDKVWDYKDIIQWLSISDTPIDDLISYLK